MIHCSLCGTPGFNKRTCQLNITGGGKRSKGKKQEQCMNCGSEWIYIAPAGREMFCETCYMHQEVVKYHKT